MWNKQRKAEILVDVDDVALGHETRLRWNPSSEWIYSNAPAHEPFIDEDTFAPVQTLLAARSTPSARALFHQFLRKLLLINLSRHRLDALGHYQSFPPSSHARRVGTGYTVARTDSHPLALLPTHPFLHRQAAN